MEDIVLECPLCHFASCSLLSFHCSACDCRGCQYCVRRAISGDWLCAQCLEFPYLELDASDMLHSSNFEVQAPDLAFIGVVSRPDSVDDHVQAGTCTEFWVQGRVGLIPVCEKEGDEDAPNSEDGGETNCDETEPDVGDDAGQHDKDDDNNDDEAGSSDNDED